MEEEWKVGRWRGRGGWEMKGRRGTVRGVKGRERRCREEKGGKGGDCGAIPGRDSRQLSHDRHLERAAP